MQLLKVTNLGIKVGAETIPVIRAVFDSFDSTVSQADANAFMHEIYNRCIGFSCATAYFTNRIADFTRYPFNTSFVLGDNTGFKLEVRTTGRENSYQAIYFTRLYYKGVPVATATMFTGYSNYEYGYLVILTDKNYNIAGSLSLQGASGINIRSNNYEGVNDSQSVPISLVTSEGSYIDVQPQWVLDSTSNSIRGDISGEVDPSITDPYAPGGESDVGGGTGDFDGTSDSIDFPALPTLGATDTGFISLFNPTLAQLNALASYMWSSSFDVSLYKKLVTDPLDCILGLSIVPVAIPDGGSGAITVGNMVTPIFLTKAGAQYVEVDCGSINVNEFWGAYLDFEPYTKAEIYLPYCGTHPLSVDDIMGKTVAVKYHVDILSGACCAYVKCGGNVLYSFIGQCASSIPITGGDWTNMINGVLSAAVSIGTMVATGGMSAPLAVAGVASTAVNGFKPSIEKSGAMSGTGGMLAIQKPYLILTRPKQALPGNQNGFIGYPSFVTSSLGDLSGYTEIESIHLQGVPATGEELAEIEQMLKMGVIL